MRRGFALGLGFLLACGAALADGTDEQSPAQRVTAVWINAGMLSRHFDRNKSFREDNHGFGAEAAFSDENSAIVGYFKNSDDDNSNYLGWMWKPWALGPARLGFVAALFDGYPRINDGGWFPAVFPVASLEYRAVGVNLTVVPTIGDRLHGALVVQFKLRVW